MAVVLSDQSGTAPLGRECQRCLQACVGGRYARYCDVCRAAIRGRRRKWISNESIDRELRRIYHERLGKHGSEIPCLRSYGERIGWPKWALMRRARQLGFGRTKELPWSDHELRVLRQWAWMNPKNIQKKLDQAGFHRTETAIHLKLQRLRLKGNLQGYSATALAQCFGVDSHCVTRWIRLRYLKATLRQTDRTTQQGGDSFFIQDHDVRAFILKHPTVFDIRKVDQLWFLDLVTEGKVAS